MDKVIKAMYGLSVLAVPAGVLLMVGTVGHADYMEEIGKAVSTWYIARGMLIGIMMCCSHRAVKWMWRVYRRGRRNRDAR